MLGVTWRMDGIRHPQLFGIENVPRVTPAAMMAPADCECQREWEPSTISRTDEPRRVEERTHDRALLWVRELTNHGGGGHDGEWDAEPEQEPGDDEHRDCVPSAGVVQTHHGGGRTILRGCLEDRTDDHDDAHAHHGARIFVSSTIPRQSVYRLQSTHESPVALGMMQVS